MAELTSSVITIANVFLNIIEATVKYIKDIKLVNNVIKELLVELKRLYRLVGVVASTYREAGPSDNSLASRLVGRTLSTCQEHINRLEPLIGKLAALESETWLQRLTVKRQLDRVRREIDSIMRNIRQDMDSMGYGISCWTLSVTNTLRRLSETTAAQQAVVVPADVMNSAREDVHTMERSLSQAATVFDNDPDLQLRYVSTSMSSLSRLSIPSTSSRPQRASSDRSNSVASTTASTLAPADSESNWDDFHYYVVKCRGDKERIEQIRDILQRHSDGSTLAKSTDTWHRTPLHVAAQHGDVDLAQVLVTFGADVNAQDSELSSVLDMAIERKHRNFVAFLLDHGANDSAVLPSNIEVLGKMQRVIRFEKIATQ
jgi:hypothetical protein